MWLYTRGFNKRIMNVDTGKSMKVSDIMYNNRRMIEMEKKPEVTQRNIKARKITYYILGALEIFFVFRLIFKVLGANPESMFVNIIYTLTNIFLAPFKGIFRSAVADGIETQSVLEPELLIAMATYAVLAWGVVKIIELNGRQKDDLN